MKKRILLIVTLTLIQLNCVLAQTNADIFLPKKIIFGNNCYQTYKFDKESRLTKTVFSIDYGENGHEKLVSYSNSIYITYDKKTGKVTQVKVYESFYEHKEGYIKSIGYRTSHSYTYKFPYNQGKVLNMDIIYTNNEFKKTAYSGQIQIDTEGELFTARTDIDNIRYNTEYDDSGNLLQNTQNNKEAYFFKYGDKKGMLSDTKTPLWIFPTFFNIAKDYEPLFTYLDRGLLVNNMVEAAFATLNEDTKETITGKSYKFTYEYNAQGYPVSITVTDNKGEILPPVLIEYEIRKTNK